VGVALAGQALFLLYVLVFYGGAALRGEPETWNRVLPKGYVPGDSAHNLLVAGHLLFTVLILVGGALQLWPALRRAKPALHRWNGRVYMVSAAVLALGGLAMVWDEIIGPKIGQRLGITLNALLILYFAARAWTAARQRLMDAHRRWALRLWLAVGGVWFFRIGLMLWILIWRAPVGFDPKTFTGPTLTALAFAQTLLPLALAEAYFRARASGRGQRATTVALWLASALTLAGIAAAYLMLWSPRL
jgi:uncharacterized membrane protein